MLSRYLIIISFLVPTLLFLPSLSSAITCSECTLEACNCLITECDSGIFNTYASSDCSGIPTKEYFFIDGKMPWKPMEITTYYTMAFCNDRATKSPCTPVTVAGEAAITTATTTTTAGYEPVELDPFLVGVLIVAAIIIVGIIIIAIYSFT